MKILLTGGAGFIGSHILEELGNNHDFVVVDDLSTGHESNLNVAKNVTFYKETISNFKFIEKLFSKHTFDAIIHLAAIASVFKCVEDPFSASEINFRSSIFLMEHAFKNGIEKFIFASSAAVYGEDPKLPKSESGSTTLPISTYGVDKFASEQFLMDYSRRGKIKGTAFRFFNVFGERQDPSSPYSGVLSIFSDRVVDYDSPELTIFGDGKQTRDFIYVKDIVSAISLALNNDSLSGNVFNLGTSNETSLLDVIKELEEITSKKISLNYKEERLGDIKRSVCDNSKIKALGWNPEYSFKEGLTKLTNSLK